MLTFLGAFAVKEDSGKPVPQATQGMQVAVSMDKPTVGRHIFEKDVLYAKVPEPDVRTWMGAFADQLSEDEQATLKEYIGAMRKKSPFFAF